jgi:hypothetical protein
VGIIGKCIRGYIIDWKQQVNALFFCLFLQAYRQVELIGFDQRGANVTAV